MRQLEPIRWRIAAAWLLLISALSGSAASAPAGAFSYPETRAGEIARAYFEAFNSGDAQKLRAFEMKYRSPTALEKRPVEGRVTRLMALREQTGTLEPGKVLAETPNSLTVVAFAVKAGLWINCTFSLEEEDPRQLISVAILPGTAPEAEAAYAKEWKDLADLLGQIREKTGAPAIAAATVDKGKITDIAVIGERWVGSGQAAERDDCFHMGSITKSMTATMIGALVEKQLLSWDMTVGDILVEMDMRDEYRDVTLEQLLEHRGGLPAYTHIGEREEKRLAALPGDSTRQREAFVSQVLMEEPVATPGSSMNYSNAGYAVAALMAERTSGRRWEDLMQEQVFDACGMKTAGFGWPSTPGRPNQPRGHFKQGDRLRPQEFGEYELGAYLAPGGDVHCSIGDLARYAVVHLRGLSGRDDVFLAQTIRRLHSPPQAAGDEMRYAAGWAVVHTPEVGEVHTHSGSAGTFFATIELYPEYDAAVVLATNADTEVGTVVSKEITDLVKRRIKERDGQRSKETSR
jgi:CubicO group peptidase (beta-lactamase class C family)